MLPVALPGERDSASPSRHPDAPLGSRDLPRRRHRAGAILALGMITFRLVEKPIMKLKHRNDRDAAATQVGCHRSKLVGESQLGELDEPIRAVHPVAHEAGLQRQGR